MLRAVQRSGAVRAPGRFVRAQRWGVRAGTGGHGRAVREAVRLCAVSATPPCAWAHIKAVYHVHVKDAAVRKVRPGNWCSAWGGAQPEAGA